jgi:hypothetical protein
MKKTIKIIMSFLIISVAYYITYYMLWHIDVDIMKERIPHHFLAGVYVPYVFYAIYNIKHKKASLWLPFVTYLAVCVLWESGQAIMYEREIQTHQLLFDMIGIGVGYNIKHLLGFPRGAFFVNAHVILTITPLFLYQP